ncbi:hypothetical protein CYMTET_38238 [Cymbomonas tetramitiformis]|uniref:Uncharacterized protein n=1 Tax=Cymbomonas tetramitiformis TaxID=36881 RepID=A0AAE0CCG3_9CHLO|nr:hypothetical protein CYMTET_38238 [Cymbomonas tetramitiformis]
MSQDESVGEKMEMDPSQKVLEIDKKYASFRVLPKPDEVNDKNFPPHLHAAAQLFMMTGMIPQVKQMKLDVDRFMETLQAGPDGKSSFALGTACVCWQCGHVGLPSNADEVGEKLLLSGICRKCKSDEQTNYVKLTQADGTAVPWLEPKETVDIPENAVPEPVPQQASNMPVASAPARSQEDKGLLSSIAHGM